MTKPRVVSAAFLLLVLLAELAFAPSARADSQVRIVRLSLVDGPVQIDRATGLGFEKAIMNMPITQGMRITTQDEGRAEVEFENGTTLRLAPRTDVTFAQLGLRSSGARFTSVEVSQGTAYFNVRHKGDDDFRVAFANREISLDRNVHFRLDLSGGNPELAVFNGELQLNGPQGRATVKKNETLTLDLGDAGRYDLARNIMPEAYDSWDNERIAYDSQYAFSSYNTRSPYYYGNSDLNYYGSWSSWPGYGTLWRPFGVGYGWDPFYNGAWAWYPGFGYTWVSTYPWGWTPYRYGSWIFVPSAGWCWRPGGWSTWYTVPPVYNAPPSFHPPKPPPPVAVLNGGGTAGPRPTVFVDNGVGVIRNPRILGSLDDAPFRDGNTKAAGGIAASAGAGASAGATFAASPSRRVVPAPGTGIAAPGTPAPMRSPRSDMRGRIADQDAPARMGPRPGVERGAPPPRVERSAPPAPRMSAPRMSSPPPARMSAPSGGSRGQGHAGSSASKSPK